jgi:polyphosphate:AMP phosphotransferase
MFEAAELGKKLYKSEYAAALPELRESLLAAHFAIKDAGVPVLIIVSGVDGAGKAELVHRLNEWLDPRGVDTHASWQSSDDEEERPHNWRFWRRLPAKGRIGIFFGSWYTPPILDRVYDRTKKRHFDVEMDRIVFLEQMLAQDGVLIIKLWFHLPKKVHKINLKEMAKNPRKHWRVMSADWDLLKNFDEFVSVSERAIRLTDSAEAPWHVVEASDRRYRELTSGRIIVESIQKCLAAPKMEGAKRVGIKKKSERDERTILDAVDLSQEMSGEKYDLLLKQYQGELSRLVWKANQKKVSSVIVFEGWDAAGKGSAIRRVTGAMDPQFYRVIPIAAPTDEERAHHYMWRFWRHLPRAGKLVIFDRSWYGRVLVERVEGFARTDEWQRAFVEINDFEEQLIRHGVVLSKFWLHIGKDEQLRRFKLRQEDVTKQHKITEEDWRNRRKWDAYKLAVNEMVERTSTAQTPWTLVAGNDKRTARIQILRTICENLETKL